MAKVKSIPLGEVAEINPSVFDKVLEDPGLRVSFVPMSAVSETTASVISPEERVAGDCRKSFTPFARGDVLVAKITPCFENGKIVLADIPHPFGFGSTEFHVVRARPAKLDPRFLLHALRQPVFRLKGERRMTGSAGQRRVPENFLSTFAIPLPPLDEQRRIVAILDKADELRAKRRAALAKLDSLTQSIFLDLFGDPATNPKGWPIRTLDELDAEFRYGTSVKSSTNGKPALRIPNVIGGSIDLSDLKLVPVTDEEFGRLQLRDGDLLFVRTNGNPDFVGRCALFDSPQISLSGLEPDKFVYASYLIRARIPQEEVEPVFLRDYLCGAEGRRQLRTHCKTSAGQYNINTEGLGAITVPLPPHKLQREFVERVEAVGRVHAIHRTAVGVTDSLFGSLQYRAFQGGL